MMFINYNIHYLLEHLTHLSVKVSSIGRTLVWLEEDKYPWR